MFETSAKLRKLFDRLLAHYGPQHWWPAETPFEVIIGAILTQAAAWANVEKALQKLKGRGVLTPAALRALPEAEMAELVRSSGYFNAKARKIKALVEHMAPYHDDLARWFSRDVGELRAELLGIYGVGEETADAILLYAAGKPVFVVDAYTRRIVRRLGLAPVQNSYGAFQALFMELMPRDERLFNEYHALLVAHGKQTCKKVPLCDSCCLQEMCEFYLKRPRP